MKVRIYEHIIESVDVEVPDDLDGRALLEAIELERCETTNDREFVEFRDFTWEVIE